MKKILQTCALLLLAIAVAQSATATTQESRADAYYHYMMGAMKENLRDYNAAIDEYKLALNGDPEASEIFARLAALYAQTDRLDEAVRDAEKAVQRNPDNEDAHRM